MNHETTQQAHVGRETLSDVARKLGAAIVATPEYQAFNEAEQGYQSDAAARQLLQQYQDAQQSLQLMQQLGSDGSEEAQRLDTLRQRIETNPTLTAYFNGQDALVGVLRELNKFISERLDLDFAGLTRPRSGCCG